MAKTRTMTGFDDQTITGGIRDKVETYKGAVGRSDLVRIMTVPVMFYGSRIEWKDGSDKGFFAQSLADVEDIDAENWDACKAKCPLFERGYIDCPPDPKAKRFVVGLYWIKSRKKNGREEKVGKFLPWPFAGERYGTLRSIQDKLPVNPETGKKKGLSTIELWVDCSDEKMQKLTFMAVTDRAQMTGTLKEARAAVADYFKTPDDWTPENCLPIEEFLAPESKANLNRSLDRAEGKSKEGMDDDEGLRTPAAAGKTAKPGAPKPKPAEEDEDDADLEREFKNAMGEDEGDEGDATPPPVTTKPKAAAPGGAAPAAYKPVKDAIAVGKDTDGEEVLGKITACPTGAKTVILSDSNGEDHTVKVGTLRPATKAEVAAYRESVETAPEPEPEPEPEVAPAPKPKKKTQPAPVAAAAGDDDDE